MTGLDRLHDSSRRGTTALTLLIAIALLAAAPGAATGAEPEPSPPRVHADREPPTPDGERPSADAKPAPTTLTTPDPRPGKPPRAGTVLNDEPDPPGEGDRIVAPASLDLFKSAGFRYQDTNYYACTSTSVMNMLNMVSLGGQGGSGFRWKVRLDAPTRDSILAWERTHDTLAGGNGSDPHGWRNALNYYGWGSSTLQAKYRVYEDYAHSTYDRAVKAAIRAMIRWRKPVGIAAWRGTHAHMLTGYDGLVGDPFAVNSAGAYTNAFTIAAVRLTDPLKVSAVVNKRIAYTSLKSTTNTRIRFQPYYETDSPYDDPYTTGWVRARDEWYGRWVIIAPRR